MNDLLIGNIIALLASLVMVYSGLQKEKKRILYFQSIQIALFIVSNIVLGGITGAIINIIGLVRNILCYKDKLGIKEKLVITILSLILSLAFNNMGFIGLLPTISTVSFIWLMNVKDVKKFKLVIIFTMILWFIYDINIKSYTSAVFDFGAILAHSLTLIQIKKK